MKTGRNHLVLYWIITLAALVAVPCPRMITFAGEINGNEAGVISAASGTFTYDGKTYRAGSAYINSLTAYLSADDVDLDSDQASRAISMMYDSVAEGIERGYLYEVGGSSTSEQETAPGQTTEAGQPAETGENGTAFIPGESTEILPGVDASTEEITGASAEEGASLEEGTEEGSAGSSEEKGKGGKSRKSDKSDKSGRDVKDGSTEEESEFPWAQAGETDPASIDVWEAMSNETAAKTKLQERPVKEDASATVKLDSEDIVITTGDGFVTVSKVRQLIPDSVIMVMNGISLFLLAITVICGIILFMKKCMVFRKPKGRRARPGHTKRRRIRRYTRNVLTVTTTISLVGVFALLAIYISLFNQNTIMQNMQSSGYFNYAYSEYVSEIAKKTLASGDLKQSEDIMVYEDFLFNLKQNSIRILNGDTDVVIPDSNVAPYIYNMKRSYMMLFRQAGIYMILSLLLGIVLMIFMDQSRERGIKHTAVADLVASGILILFLGIMAVAKPYQGLYIEPDYLYLFIMECVRWSMKVMTSIIAFGVVLGMILIGVYKTVKNQRTE